MADPDAVAALYDKWVNALEQVERLRAERNAIAKAMKVGRGATGQGSCGVT